MDSEILTKMRMGTASKFPVTLKDFTVYLRPLTVIETVNLASEVEAEIKKYPVEKRNAINEHVIFSVKMLEKASTSAPDKNDYQLTTRELSSFTPDELQYFFKEYTAGNDRINPNLDKISIEKLTELVNLAKKNPSALIELSFWEVVNLSWYLITLLTDK
jgi:hypothetical protein